MAWNIIYMDAPGNSADAFGISNYAITSLITGINNGLAFGDDHGGNSASFTSDGTGNYAILNWAGGGTAGLRWTAVDTAQKQIYLRYDLRRSQNDNTKELKVFSKNYPTTYSNCTWGCNTGGYIGVTQGLSYSDATGGGDIGVQFNLGSYPTLTGGSAFTRTPHPTLVTQTASNESISSVWETHEIFWLQNDDGINNGEVAKWFNGALVLHLTDMWNCGTGQQGLSRVDLGAYANIAGVVEHYRKFYGSYDRPVGRGI